MAVLLNAVTVDTVGTGTATTTADSLIEVPNTSVFGQNGAVEIQASSVNTTGLFGPIDRIAVLRSPGCFTIRLPVGHFVRAVLTGSGPTTSVTVSLLDIT